MGKIIDKWELILPLSEIDKKLENNYLWEVQEWFELWQYLLISEDEWYKYDYYELHETYEHRLQMRIQELREKLMDWTITKEEIEELKLLIG